MANAKISALPAASVPLAGTEVLPIVQGGVTEQVSVANLTAGRAVATGNLGVTGTVTVSGDVVVNVDKFSVVAASGNTLVSGTLGAIGLTTLAGGLVGGVQTLSGPGAVNLVSLATAFTSTATGNALTLANGALGQIKTITYVAEAAGADTGILIPTTRLAYASITFNTVGDSAVLIYQALGWAILSVRGAVVA